MTANGQLSELVMSSSKVLAYLIITKICSEIDGNDADAAEIAAAIADIETNIKSLLTTKRQNDNSGNNHK